MWFSLYIHIMSLMLVYALIFTLHANKLNHVLVLNLHSYGAYCRLDLYKISLTFMF
jgi:hypothetical protein